jgi:hypothetical protein
LHFARNVWILAGTFPCECPIAMVVTIRVACLAKGTCAAASLCVSGARDVGVPAAPRRKQIRADRDELKQVHQSQVTGDLHFSLLMVCELDALAVQRDQMTVCFNVYTFFIILYEHSLWNAYIIRFKYSRSHKVSNTASVCLLSDSVIFKNRAAIRR